jgi:hypothetical protein
LSSGEKKLIKVKFFAQKLDIIENKFVTLWRGLTLLLFTRSVFALCMINMGMGVSNFGCSKGEESFG